MGELLKSVGAACALVAVLTASAVAADDERPLVLEPASHWHLDYGEDSCRLLRVFGAGENKSVVLMERYEPGDGFFIVVGGKPLDTHRYADTTFRFGPGGYEYDGPSQAGDFGEYSPAVMANGMFLVAPPDFREEDRNDFDVAEMAQDTDIFEHKVSAEQEAAISWLEVQRGRARPVRFELGSMRPPMAAMRKCTDELLTHCGIDLEAHRDLTRAAVPASDPARWVRSGDYPADLLLRGAQGIVQFRLSVGPDGKPTQCHIQKSTRPEGFDKAVCEALMRRATFEPALDAQEQPIASYWRSAVRFEMP